MPVNFQQLQNIPMPQVVAQMPGSSNNALNTGAGGFMQGILQGQQMQNNDMILQQRQQEMADQQALRSAAAQGGDAYREQLAKMNPQAAIQYDTDVAKHTSALLQIEGQKLQNQSYKEVLTKAQRERAIDNAAIAGSVVQYAFQQAQQGQDPVQAFNSQIPELNKRMPGLSLTPIKDVNELGAVAQAIQRVQGMSVVKEKETEKVQTLTQLQTKRDNLEASLGQASDPQTKTNIQRALDETTALIQTHTQNKQTQVTNVTDQVIARADEAQLKKINESKFSRVEYLDRIQKTKAALDKTPGLLLNPVASLFGLSKVNPEVQVLVGNLNDLMLTLKNIRSMGSQGFTDKDAQIVKEVNGDIGNYKGSIKQLLDDTQSILEHKALYDWKQEAEVYKKSSQYDKWLEANPEPYAKVESIDKNGQKVQMEIPVTKLEEAKKRGWSQI